jgi:hypothetical protein
MDKNALKIPYMAFLFFGYQLPTAKQMQQCSPAGSNMHNGTI